MTELITTLLLFVDESLVYWIPALILIGYAVKHCTNFPNALIPLVEVGAGAFIGVVFGLAKFADTGVCGGLLAVIKFAGQGALIGIIAIALYDMIHGVIKTRLAKKEEKE